MIGQVVISIVMHTIKVPDSMNKIDTQGMSLPGKSKRPSSYAPMPVKIRTIFTPEERIELKQIINEALDEREQRS